MLLWSQSTERQFTGPAAPAVRLAKVVPIREPQRWYRTLMYVALAVCLALAFLVREQARVVQNQRILIHDLFRDSEELNQLKVEGLKKQADKHTEQQKMPVPKWALRGCLPFSVCA